MPDTVLVADHGVAAVRVLRACQAHSAKAVSVHTAADASALHATSADDTVLLGPDPSSYDDVLALVEAAGQAGADAVHPGGREVPGLEKAVLDAGLVWLGGTFYVPVEVSTEPSLLTAHAGSVAVAFPILPPRAVEVVTGLDFAGAALLGTVEAVPRDGVAISVDVRATTLAPLTVWDVPKADDLWVDAAVKQGSTPIDPLLAVVTAWAPDRDTALARLAQVWDAIALEGPTVGRPKALERGPQ